MRYLKIKIQWIGTNEEAGKYQHKYSVCYVEGYA